MKIASLKINNFRGSMIASRYKRITFLFQHFQAYCPHGCNITVAALGHHKFWTEIFPESPVVVVSFVNLKQSRIN